MNQGFTYRENLGPEADGLTALEYLTLRYRHSSEKTWRTRIEEGRVWVGGSPAHAARRLRRGETLLWNRPPWQEPDAPASFAILFRDEHLLAVAKPRGLPTLPGGGFLVNTLLSLVRKEFPGASPLHRLGRGTSGVVLFARTDLARSTVSAAWERSEVTRAYRGLVAGVPEWDEVPVEAPIGLVPHPLLGGVYGVTRAGKPARSLVRVLEKREGMAVVHVSIQTGRTHQVRIHLAAAGHPLLGDPLYPPGGVPSRHTMSLPGDLGYWLHAERLGFLHPEKREPIGIECQPPSVLRCGAHKPPAEPEGRALRKE